MDKKFLIFRNELKNSRVPSYKVIGIVSELILSKVIFQKNDEIRKFIKEVFNLELKDYLYKSRTLLVARLTREILKQELSSKQTRLIYDFIEHKIEFHNNDSKNQLNGWI
ncbi:hypothetical protein ACS6Y5_04710 [Streptococcus suis]|uniref:hypothetical protein n=1 Tax=Streptococcus TaxID=1301 RepID=UPI002AA430D2|nr:hypothetical protein [Streptococcus suis]HEM6488888.1 hypothetical protein [Streptococcus suis]